MKLFATLLLIALPSFAVADDADIVAPQGFKDDTVLLLDARDGGGNKLYYAFATDIKVDPPTVMFRDFCTKRLILLVPDTMMFVESSADEAVLTCKKE